MSTDLDDVGEDRKIFASSEAWDLRAEAYVVARMLDRDECQIRLEIPVARKLVVDRVQEALKDKEKAVVLDVASGGGEPALTIAKACPHAEVHGTDFASKMVELIRKRAEESGVLNLKPSAEDATKLEGFDAASVDVVTCTWGLEYILDTRSALQQFHRVLRDGGMAVFATWENTENTFWIKIYNVMKELAGGSISGEILLLGKDEGAAAKKEMEEAGFEDVKVSQVMIPVFAPAGTGHRELFDFITKASPLEVILTMMEENGRSNVREEGYAIFEAMMEKDKAEGKAPPGPGLSAPGEPAHDEKEPILLIESLIVEGHKSSKA